MSIPTVQIDAARIDKSLVKPVNERRKLTADPALLMWRRLVDLAVRDAKQTVNGIPTDGAILARWWIAEHKPKQTEKEEWERSFDCACSWLSLDPVTERVRFLKLIDESLQAQLLAYVQTATYVRRGMVLACAGVPTAIARQFLLPLVSVADYDDVAGVDYGDQFALYDQRVA